jgi:L-rhamnose mutarotase
MKNEASLRAEFKRNHKDVWTFILSKTKTAGLSETTPMRPKMRAN